MGSRAVITTSQSDELENSQDIGLYTQFYGPRDCVEAFLTYCKMRNFPSPERQSIGWHGLCTVMENFSGENARISIGKCCDLGIDFLDYGVYVIQDWEIIDRKHQFAADESDYHIVSIKFLCTFPSYYHKKVQKVWKIFMRKMPGKTVRFML